MDLLLVYLPQIYDFSQSWLTVQNIYAEYKIWCNQIFEQLYDMFSVVVNNGIEWTLCFNSMPVIDYEIIDKWLSSSRN